MSGKEEALSFSSSRKRTKIRKSVLDVDSTAKLLLKNNPSRVAVYFANMTGTLAAVGIDNSVTTTFGFPLEQSGGVIVLNRRDDGVLPESEFWLVATADNTNILCWELLEVKENTKNAS